MALLIHPDENVEVNALRFSLRLRSSLDEDLLPFRNRSVDVRIPSLLIAICLLNLRVLELVELHT